MVSLGPKRLLKAQFFGIKANFPVKKEFWPNFFVVSYMTNIREQFVKVQKVF